MRGQTPLLREIAGYFFAFMLEAFVWLGLRRELLLEQTW
jgi:hypothetical protein